MKSLMFTSLLLLFSCGDEKAVNQTESNNLPKQLNTSSQNNGPTGDTHVVNNFEKYTFPFSLKEVSDEASCFFYKVYDANGLEVEMDEQVKKAMDCPSLLDLYQGELLVYQVGDDVMLLDFLVPRKLKLFTLYKDIDGVSNPAWLNKNKLLFQVINQNRVGDYKEATRLICLDISDRDKIRKKKFDRISNFECGSMCSGTPNKDYGFYDDQTIWYRRNENLEEGPGAIILISLNNTDYVDNKKINTFISGEISSKKLKFCELIRDEQEKWIGEIDLGVGGIREDHLIEIKESTVFKTYVYRSYTEHGRGGGNEYYFTLLNKNNEVLRKHEFIGFVEESIQVLYQNQDLVFTILKGNGDVEKKIISLPDP